MAEVTINMYRAQRGKGDCPSARMRRARAGVCSYALAVSATKGAA